MESTNTNTNTNTTNTNTNNNMEFEDKEAIETFDRKVDSNISKIYDSYGTILKLGQVSIM